MSLLKHLLLSHRYGEQTRVSLRCVFLVLAIGAAATVLFVWAIW